jgi:hypothetical protein
MNQQGNKPPDQNANASLKTITKIAGATPVRRHPARNNAGSEHVHAVKDVDLRG